MIERPTDIHDLPRRQGGQHFTMRVPSDLRRLSDVRGFVDKVTDAVDFDGRRVFDLKVATSEAAANAMEHSGRAGDEITLAADVSPDGVTVEVLSRGDFALAGTPKERSRTRGMGLPLMAALTDQLTLRHRREGGLAVGLTIFSQHHG